MILYQKLMIQAGKNLNGVALLCSSAHGTQEILNKELLSSIAQMSNSLRDTLPLNSRVALLSENSPEWVFAFFALTQLRCTVIPLNPSDSPELLSQLLIESNATHLITSSSLQQKAEELMILGEFKVELLEIQNHRGESRDILFTPRAGEAPKESDPILLLRSSGASGPAKWIPFTHEEVLKQVEELTLFDPATPEDCFMTPISWSHPFSLTQGLLLPLLTTHPCAMNLSQDPTENLLRSLEQTQATRLVVTPQESFELVAQLSREKKTLPKLKSITVGLGYLSAELKRVFEILKIQVIHCYGQTESLWCIAMEDLKALSPGAPYQRGFFGRILPSLQFQVLSDQGTPTIGDSRRGELVINVPSSQSKEGEFISPREYKTGDLVQITTQAGVTQLTLLGRKHEIFAPEHSLQNLYEIESALKKHPGVEDAAAFSALDQEKKPYIQAVVVRKEENQAEEKEILDACNALLAEKLRPQSVQFVDEIPRDRGKQVIQSQLRLQLLPRQAAETQS